MGIKGFNPIIKKHCPQILQFIRYSSLRGKKIAIDVSILMNKNLYGASINIMRSNHMTETNEDHLMYKFLDICLTFVISLLIEGIFPVFVFDGERRPEKQDTTESRNKSRENTRNKAHELEGIISNGENTQDNIDKLIKLKSRVKPEEAHTNSLRDLLRSIGFTCLTATYDAEKLCSMLCIEGKVDAVYSNDTDCIALGCPVMFTKHETKVINNEKVKCFDMVKIKDIRDGLGLNQEELLHLCMLLGNDFNDNIPSMGGVGCLNYIKNHRLINDSTLYNLYGNKSLEFIQGKDNNYKKSLKIFERESSDECCIDETDIEINIDIVSLRGILEEYQLEHLTDRLVSSYERFKEYNR